MVDVFHPPSMDAISVGSDGSLAVLNRYLSLDQDRQTYLAQLIDDLDKKRTALAVALVDLDHERSSRRSYQERADKVEATNVCSLTLSCLSTPYLDTSVKSNDFGSAFPGTGG